MGFWGQDDDESRGTRPVDEPLGELELVHEFTEGPMPTGVSVSHTGRIFVNFPKWGDEVPATVVELRDGVAVPFPDEAWNSPDGDDDAEALVSVQSIVVDPADPVSSAERALDGKADVVFECVGIPGLIAQAVQQVRNRGTILLLGLCTKPDTFNSFAMLSKEVRLVTSAFFTTHEYEAALAALEGGALEPRALVTDTITLGDTPEVFESLKRRSGQCKVLIAP